MDRCSTFDESGIGQSSDNGMRCDDQRQYFTERVERHGLYLETHTIQLKKRAPELFEQAQHDIAELIKQAEANAIELAISTKQGLHRNHRITQLGRGAARFMPLQPNADSD